MKTNISRRQFGFLLSASVLRPRAQDEPDGDVRSRIALVKSPNRKAALAAALDRFGRPDFAGRDLYIKANYGNPWPYPATTHPDCLATVVELLRRCNCGGLTLLERSGMGGTRDVWGRLGVDALARRLDVALLALEELTSADQWRLAEMPGSHWAKGVAVPRFLDEEARVVLICNVKTHRFGAVFSASLKNSLGLAAKRGAGSPPRNFMQELHSSPHQSLMIAELNQLYTPALVFMDGGQVLINGGPESGDTAEPALFAVASDRVAIDAIAVSVLRIHGADGAIRRTDVFAHEQIKRAAELKLGAGCLDGIEILTDDDDSRNAALQIRAALSGARSDNDEKER